VDIEKALGEYLDYLEVEKNRSIKTRENYGRYLERYVRDMSARDIADMTIESIKKFRLLLARQEPTLKKSTQAYYIIAIRNFLKYLIKQDYNVLAPEKIELPKMVSRQIEVIDAGELERLLKSPGDNNDLKTLRDKALLETLFSTGLRIAELCALDRYIDLEKGEITVRGKGDKLRLVFLSNRAKELLKKYIDKRGDTEEALFVSIKKSKKQ
jgi:site-specific recombinase XerD